MSQACAVDGADGIRAEVSLECLCRNGSIHAGDSSVANEATLVALGGDFAVFVSADHVGKNPRHIPQKTLPVPSSQPVDERRKKARDRASTGVPKDLRKDLRRFAILAGTQTGPKMVRNRSKRVPNEGSAVRRTPLIYFIPNHKDSRSLIKRASLPGNGRRRIASC
jgi:hypothetical protein